MGSSGTFSQKDSLFKAIETPQNLQSAEDTTESHGRREDLTAETEVLAPGIMQRAAEEVEAVAAALWDAIIPGSKK